MKNILYFIVSLQSLVYAVTNVSGNISSDTTWTVANSPYYVSGSLTVESGVTLTLEAGTVLKFDVSGYSLSKVGISVNGILKSEGTSSMPVYFTAYTDDNISGDSNEDGDATTPVPGAWGSVNFNDESLIDMNHTIIRYSGGSKFLIGNSYHYATLRANNAPESHISLDYVFISQCSGDGFYLHNVSDVNITQSIFDNMKLWINDGHINIDNSNFTSSSAGVIISDTGDANISYNDFSQTNTALEITSTAMSGDITNNTFTENNKGIYIKNHIINSQISDNHFNNNSEPITLENNAVATVIGNNIYQNQRIYISGSIDNNISLLRQDIVYVASNFTVNAGTKLTINPDVIIKFQSRRGMQINGELEVNATAGHEAYFTAYTDDSVGGDTNEDNTTTTPSAGYWNHISLADNASATIRHAVMRYGGYDSYSYYPRAILYKTGNNGRLDVSDSNITDSSYRGIRLVNARNANTFTNLYVARANPCFQAENSLFDINGSSFSECTGNGAIYATNNSEGNITNNTMVDGSYGIYLNTSDTNITNNTITDTYYNAIKVYKSLALIKANTIKQTAQEGIYLSGIESNQSVMINNTIFHNKIGIDVRDNIEPQIGGSVAQSNDIYLNRDYGVLNHSTGVNVNANYNWWGDESGPFHDPNNLQGEGNTVSDNVTFDFYLAYSNNKDDDNDTIRNFNDNCRIDYNPDQLDSDVDGVGDACDPYPNDAENDVDKDGIAKAVDNCPVDFNPPPIPPAYDFSLDGGESSMLFSTPSGVAISKEGIRYIVDSDNNRIVMYDNNDNYLGNFGNEGNGSGELR